MTNSQIDKEIDIAYFGFPVKRLYGDVFAQSNGLCIPVQDWKKQKYADALRRVAKHFCELIASDGVPSTITKDALLEWAKETYLNEKASAIRKVCYKQLIDKLNEL